MKIRSVILAILLGCAGNPGLAAEPNERPSILAFVQKHKDLYASEIKNDSPFSREYVSRRTLTRFEITTKYEDSSGEISIEWAFGMPDEAEVYKSCVKTGTGVGTTSRGARVSYMKETCHRIVLTRFDGNWLGETQPIGHNPLDNKLVIKGNPRQFRDVRDRGVVAQFTFVPIKSEGVVVKYEKILDGATIDAPLEQTINTYSFPGRTKQVEYFFVGGKTPFHIEQFQ